MGEPNKTMMALAKRLAVREDRKLNILPRVKRMFDMCPSIDLTLANEHSTVSDDFAKLGAEIRRLKDELEGAIE